MRKSALSLLKRSVSVSSILVAAARRSTGPVSSPSDAACCAKLRDRRGYLLRRAYERVIVHEQPRPSAQYVTVKRRLGEREIVEDPKCRRIGSRVSHDAAHQQPGQEREQQTHRADAGGDLTWAHRFAAIGLLG